MTGFAQALPDDGARWQAAGGGRRERGSFRGGAPGRPAAGAASRWQAQARSWLPGLVRVLRSLILNGSCCLGSLWLLLPLAAGAQPAPAGGRLVVPGAEALARLPPVVLSDDDRRYLAGLPELRLALAGTGTPPFETVGPDGVVAGPQAEVLALATQALGLRLRLVVWPDGAAVDQALREGRADAVLTAAVTPQRLEHLTFTLGTGAIPTAAFAAQGSRPMPLERARLAFERGSAGQESLRRRFPAADWVAFDSTTQALQAVAAGRADAYVGSLLEALHRLNEQPVPGLEVRELLTVGAGHYHVGLRQEFARLVPLLNQVIAGWRASGESGPAWQRMAQLAAASVPGGLVLPSPLPVIGRERVALAARSVWRVGAVRGQGLANEVDPQGRHQGIGADVAEQVARRLGVALQVVPFDREGDMLEALRAGRVDIVPFLGHTPQRAREFGFSLPYVDVPHVLIGRLDGPLYWDLGSLRARRLALALHHPLRDDIARLHPGIQLVDAADGDAAIDQVLAGQADAAVALKLSANRRLLGDAAGRLRVLAEVAEVPGQARFATSAAASSLVPLIDAALSDIPPAEKERMLRRWVAVEAGPSAVASPPWQLPLPAHWVPWILAPGFVLAGVALWWLRRRLTRAAHGQAEAREQLQDIGRALPCVAFRYVIDGSPPVPSQVWCSPAAQTLLGLTIAPDQTPLQALALRMPAQDRAAAQAALDQAEAEQAVFRFTGRYQHPERGVRWLHIEAVPGIAADGHQSWTGSIVDVSRERDLQLRLVRLLQDLRGRARPTAGLQEAEWVDTALRKWTEARLRAHEAAAQAKGLALRFQFDEALPARARLDPVGVRQVLDALLSRSIRDTGRGHVTLSVGVSTLPGRGPALLLQVQDTGSGLEPLPTAGGRRAQDGAAAEATAGPEGADLARCRQQVDRLGGALAVDRVPGRGTRVQVRLPLRSAARRGPARGATRPRQDRPLNDTLRTPEADR